MDKQKAIKILQRQIGLIVSVKCKQSFSPEYKKWRRDTEIAIERIFGKDGRHLSDFTKIRYNLGMYSASTPDSDFQEAYCKGLGNAGEILKSMIDEINEYWTDETPQATAQ